MATTIASSRIWNGLKVDEVTYTETGKIELNSTGGSLLASSSDYNWEIENTELFTRLYNNRARYSAQLTTTEFERTFFNEGRPLFNADRAEILNNNVNYSNLTAAENNRTQFFNNKIPGLQNPLDGRLVNQDGTFTDQNPFGATPGFLANGTPTQFGTVSLPNDQLDVADALSTDPLGGDGATQSRVARSSSSAPTLRYPLNESAEFPGDFLMIEGRQYSARKQFGDIGGSTGSLIDGTNSTVNKRLGNPTGTVILPLQAGLKETNNIGWSDDTLTFIEAAFADVALDMINKGVEDITNLPDIAKAGVKTLRSRTEAALNDTGGRAYVNAYFAGQAVGKNIVRRGTGQIANPNMELFFAKPSLREFSFTFQLSPRDDREARRVRDIIKLIKKQIRPSKSNEGLFLYPPDIFKLTYMYNGAAGHPFLYQFKPCAMVNFTVDYGNKNNYMTYRDGSMPTYTLSMAFKELEPIYQNDGFDSGSGTGTGY
jgi:hypothetical protein